MKWPQGWREVSLGQVCTLGAGDSAPQGDEWFAEDGEPFVRTSDVSANADSVYLTTTRDRLSPAAIDKLRLRRWPKSSLLFPKSGASALLNHRCLLGRDACVVSHLAILVPGELIEPEYLYWWSKSFDAARVVPDPSYPAIRLEDLARVKLPLPPLPEQQRIVEVLQAADLKPFYEAADKARQLHAALVSAAFGREITSSWRSQHADPLIIAAKHRDELLGFKSEQPSASRMWREVLLSDVIESAQPGFAQRPGEEDDGSTPQIRTHNVSPDGRIFLEGIKHVTVAEGDLERYRLMPGDVVFNNTNSEEWVGKTAVFDQHDGIFVYSNHMTRIRVRRELVLPEFLATYLHYLWSAGYSRNRAKRWVSQAAIDVPTLLKFKLPLPPLPEQQRIVEVLQAAEFQPALRRIEQAKRLQSALITDALSGRLTAAWREQHAQALGEAARMRDARLGAPAPQMTVRITEHAPAERRTDLARPRRQALIDQLSSFQHEVWNTLRFEWRGAVLADDPAAFEEFCTSPQTAWRLEGFAAGREEVRRALEQLAAIGLIRKMSLPRVNPNTGRTEYLTAFRPLREADDGSRPEEDTALADAERLARELERRRAPEAR